MPTAKERDRLEAIEELRALLKPGDTITTVLRHRSSSGMYRAIDCYLLKPGTNGHTGEVESLWLSRVIARAIGARFDIRRDAIGVGGVGMDMGFHIVYELSYALFPYGFPNGCIGERCPANDHSNGDRDYTPGHPHSAGAGGYALRHRWL